MDGADGGSGFTCNICFESADKDPIVTPCGHLYCKSCIYTWLRNPRHDSRNCPCPVCNAVIRENKLIPLYGIRRSEDSHKISQSVPDALAGSPKRQDGQISASTLAPNRPTPSAPEQLTDSRPAPSAPEFPTDPRPTPSAPQWQTDPRPVTPSASNCPTDQTLATPSTTSVILRDVCRLLIHVGKHMLLAVIELATDKLIEAVETKINQLNEAAQERDGVNEEGSGNNFGVSEEEEEAEEEEVIDNSEGNHLGPWVMLNPI